MQNRARLRSSTLLYIEKWKFQIECALNHYYSRFSYFKEKENQSNGELALNN